MDKAEYFDLLKDLLKEDRSIRRFQEDRPVGSTTLLSLIELTRYCASGRNVQPLKYRVVTEKEHLEVIFPLLKWAGYLTDWEGPEEGERPTAYMIQGLDTRITKNCLCDEGLHLQAITLGATALGIGACIIKSFNAPKLKESFCLPEWFEPSYVVALGYPAERVVIEDLMSQDSEQIKYYRTSDGVHHVPKRMLNDLLIEK